MVDCELHEVAMYRECVRFVCVQIQRLVKRVDIHIQILNVDVFVMFL